VGLTPPPSKGKGEKEMLKIKKENRQMVDIICSKQARKLWDKAFNEARGMVNSDVLRDTTKKIFTEKLANFVYAKIQEIDDKDEQKQLLKEWKKANWKEIADYFIALEDLDFWW
jgi:hypothetical protein